MTDLMVDIEAIGNIEKPVITQIGAIYFNRYTGETDNPFIMCASPQSSEQYGARPDSDTVYWWLKQDRQAIDSMIGSQRWHIKQVLDDFYKYQMSAANIWSHATYDFSSLNAAYKMIYNQYKLSYRKCRDLRTLVDLSGIDTNSVPREGIHHNGLDDAKHQVKYAVKAFLAIRDKKKGF